MSPHRLLWAVLAVPALILLPINFCCAPFFTAAGPDQPAQPAEGPGSDDYPHHGFTMNFLGEGTRAYYLFEPSAPVPDTAPVVVFMHGFRAVNPSAYGGWIKHLVFKGHIVIFPVYQVGELTDDTTKFMSDAIAAITDALDRLQTAGHVTGDTDRFAYIGHSLGAVLSANLAAVAAENDLPVPKALFLATPGDVGKAGLLESLMQGMDYSTIPADTLLLATLEADDQLVDHGDTRQIIEGAASIPAENKQVVMHFPDDTGTPPIQANHLTPNAFEDAFGTGGAAALFNFTRSALVIDAADYYGYWKWSEALLEAAFHGRYRAYALGGTPQQLDMGTWSDGTPVRPAEVVEP